MKKLIAAVATAGLATLVSACGQDQQAAVTSTKPTPAADKQYAGPESVLNAIEENTEIECEGPIKHDDTKVAAKAIRCDSRGGEIIISTFASRSQLNEFLAFNEDFANMLGEPVRLAVGGNWAVSVSMAGDEQTYIAQIVHGIGGVRWSSVG